MGREIRKVPPNWDHPKKPNTYGQPGEHFVPMYDRRFEDAAREWKEGFAKWEAGERPEHRSMPDVEFWEYEGAPPESRDCYRPWTDEEATWFQVWETVSEGTPVTPPFATADELIDYLATEGTFWDDGKPWSRANAASFVQAGWAPSMVLAGGVIYEPRDGLPPAPQ